MLCGECILSNSDKESINKFYTLYCSVYSFYILMFLSNLMSAFVCLTCGRSLTRYMDVTFVCDAAYINIFCLHRTNIC